MNARPMDYLPLPDNELVANCDHLHHHARLFFSGRGTHSQPGSVSSYRRERPSPLATSKSFCTRSTSSRVAVGPEVFVSAAYLRSFQKRARAMDSSMSAAPREHDASNASTSQSSQSVASFEPRWA